MRIYDNITVLKFRHEEIRRMRKLYIDRVEEGEDWLALYLKEAYPSHTFKILSDWASETMYVLINLPPTYDEAQEVVTDEDGEVFVRDI